MRETLAEELGVLRDTLVLNIMRALGVSTLNEVREFVQRVAPEPLVPARASEVFPGPRITTRVVREVEADMHLVAIKDGCSSLQLLARRFNTTPKVARNRVMMLVRRKSCGVLGISRGCVVYNETYNETYNAGAGE